VHDAVELGQPIAFHQVEKLARRQDVFILQAAQVAPFFVRAQRIHDQHVLVAFSVENFDRVASYKSRAAGYHNRMLHRWLPYSPSNSGPHTEPQ
jgi:hypothetical protein